MDYRMRSGALSVMSVMEVCDLKWVWIGWNTVQDTLYARSLHGYGVGEKE